MDKVRSPARGGGVRRWGEIPALVLDEDEIREVCCWESMLAPPARALLAHIRDGDVASGMTVRFIRRKEWRDLILPEDLEGAFRDLETAGVLRVTHYPYPGGVRKTIELEAS